MKTIDIKVIERKTLGKKATKAIRKQLHIPCVMYGHKSENIHFHAHKNDFRHIIYTPNSYIINLDIDGKQHLAKMQSIDFHPVTDEILHIDFYKIDPKKAFKMQIPIVTVGAAKGVLNEGGVLSTSRRKVFVKALVDVLPDQLEIDITDLSIGDAIRISDLQEKFKNLEFLDPQSVVVSVNVTRLAKALDDLEEGDFVAGEDGATEGADATDAAEGDTKEEKTDD